MISKEQIKYIKKYKRTKRIICFIQILLLIGFISIWEYSSTKKIINPFIFSSPSKIIKEILQLINNHTLINHTFVTLKEVLLSFSIGFTLSLLLAILFYEIPVLYKIFDPYITMLNSLPKVAIGPLILIWCGANTKSIIIMALLINLIVSFITIYTGFQKTNEEYVVLFKTFHANKIDTLWNLILPCSSKNIISSLKLTLSMSFIGVIMGEFLVSKEGIGYLIIYGTQVFNLDLVLTGVILLVILSYLLYKPIQVLEKKWR